MEKYTPMQRLEYSRSEVTVIEGTLDVRRPGYKATVEIGGTRYDVNGRACDLPNCWCDDEIIEVTR